MMPNRSSYLSSSSAECDLCLQSREGTDTCYLRLEKVSPGASSVGFRSGGFECRCCADCYRKGRMLTSLRIIYFIVFAFVVPMFLCGGGGMLAMKLFRADGAMPQGIGGVPGPEILDKFVGFASILCLLVWIAMPFVIGGMIR